MMCIVAPDQGLEEDFFSDKIDKHYLSKASRLFFRQTNRNASVVYLMPCQGPDNASKRAPNTSNNRIMAKFEKLRTSEFESAQAD